MTCKNSAVDIITKVLRMRSRFVLLVSSIKLSDNCSVSKCVKQSESYHVKGMLCSSFSTSSHCQYNLLFSLIACALKQNFCNDF